MDVRPELQPVIRDLLGPDAGRACEAVAELDRLAQRVDLPLLHDLLEDKSFFIREAAAVPLARLEGANALPVLLEALQRGDEEGHDNDSLSIVILNLVEEYEAEVAPLLHRMLTSDSPQERESARWLLALEDDEPEATDS